MQSDTLTAERLRAFVHYDPETGFFTARNSTGGWRAGRRMGWGSGRTGRSLSVQVDGRSYQLHRLAFLYMTGAFPIDQVDHINGDPKDNRWANLRDVPQTTNAQNIRKPRRDNTLGVLGVCLDKRRGVFLASLHVNGKTIQRAFPTVDEAAAFYIEKKRELHEGCTL